MKMKGFLLIIFCIFLFRPVYSQEKESIIDLLIQSYEFIYGPMSEDSQNTGILNFTCIQRPDNFYDNFYDSRIGFDLLRVKEVFIFSFSDSVSAPLKIPLRITSGYGESRNEGNRFHQGIDFGLNVGDTVYSVFCGEVRISTYDPEGYGNVVVIRNYNMSETLYGHLNKSLVKNEQKVIVGQPIGIGGNTGISSGPHLHFEIRSSGYSFNPIVNGLFLKKYKIVR